MSENIAPVSGELVQDETYGAAVTAKGLQLIAKLIATKANLTLVKVMMGSGTPPKGTYIGDLEDLVEPVAAGTISEPIYNGPTVEMIVEYRSDMNGGLQEGFFIREFGVFAKDPDGPDVMIYYGNLGKYPQYIAPWTGGYLDVRRYPISITVAEGTEVTLDGLPSVVITADDLQTYCTTTLLPQLLKKVNELLEGKQDKLTGKEGQVPVFNAKGELEAQDFSSASVFTFTEANWGAPASWGGSGSYDGSLGYEIVIPAATHKRKSSDFGFHIFHQVNGKYITNTWAALGTGVDYAEGAKTVTLSSSDRYTGKILFVG